MNSFGERLKMLRMGKGFTQAELAQALGISTSAVGMYERNLRSPSTELLISLSRLFSVSVDYLLGQQNAPESVEEILQQIHKSLTSAQGLTFNGVELGKCDVRKLFDAISIVANVILNEKLRSAEE